MSWFRPCVWRREKKFFFNIFPVSGIFPGKFDSIILLGLECTINPQNLMKIVGAIFEKIKFLVVSLCELPLILTVSKMKKKEFRYLQGDPDIEFEQDWSVGLGATLRDRNKIKNHFFSFKDFSGKSR